MNTLFRPILVLAAALLAALPSAAALAFGASRDHGVEIRVEDENWGSATREEIETLLYAVADELVSGPDRVFEHPIVVSYGAGNPVTLYRRGPAGEYLVRLSARNRHWAQFAYQFGHELCHVMSNYAAHLAAGQRGKRNQWFEEALCEAAGLFALRSMADTWQSAAPYPSWEDYAPTLRAYAERLATEPHRQLPEGMGAGRWLRANLERLARDPYLRAQNEVVANLLLPLFEEDRERWAALHALNREPSDATAGLAGYLQSWQRNAPADHRGFIGELAQRLEVLDPARAAAPSVPADGEVAAVAPELQAGSAGPLPDGSSRSGLAGAEGY